MELLSFLMHASAKIEMQKQARERGKFFKLSELKERLQVLRNAGDDTAEAELLIKMGNIYIFYADYEMSDTIYRQAAAVARQIPDRLLEGVVFANLGHSFVKRLDYDKAIFYFDKALLLAKQIKNYELIQKLEAHFGEIENIKKLERLTGFDKE